MSLLLIGLINFVSALLQACTGFGYALLAMSLMPLFLPMQVCSAVSAVTVVVIGLQMSWKLRGYLVLRRIVLPVLCCLATIPLGLFLLDTFDEMVLRLILAALLLTVTALFFYMRRRQIALPDQWYSAVAAGLITGLSTGMFNIVGPFLLVYYINICSTPMELKASLEFSFLIAGMYSTVMHIFVYHNINMETLPAILVSSVAALTAGVLGLKVYRRIDRDKISLAVYILLPIMALTLIGKGLSGK